MLTPVKRVKSAFQRLGTSATNASVGCCAIGILLVLHLFTASSQFSSITEVLNLILARHKQLHCFLLWSSLIMFGTLQILRRTDSACRELVHFSNVPGRSLSFHGELWLEMFGKLNVKTEEQYLLTGGIAMLVRFTILPILSWLSYGDWVVDWHIFCRFSTPPSFQGWYIIVAHEIWSVVPKSTVKTGIHTVRLFPISSYPTFSDLDWVHKDPRLFHEISLGERFLQSSFLS